jgi:hypothetical protein
MANPLRLIGAARSRWLPRALRLGTMVLLGATSLVAAGLVIVGGHDALLATRPQERLVGAVVLLSGLAALAGIALERRGAGGYAPAAFAAGSVGGLLLVAIQISFSNDYRTVLWLLAAALPATLAVITATRVRRRKNRLSDTVIAAVLATTATALVPLLGLLGGAFRPVSEAQTLDAQLAMTVNGERADAKGAKYAVVEATLTLENIGKRRLKIFGSVYALTGSESRPRPSPQQSQWQMPREMAQQQWSGRYEQPMVESLVETGYDFFTPGNDLDPGQHDASTFLFLVPVAQFNTVYASVTVATAFADRLRMGEQEKWAGDQQLSADSSARSQWEIEPTSWTAELTRGRPLLEVEYGIEAEDNPGRAQNPSADPRLLTGYYFDYRLGQDEQQLRTDSRFNPRIATFYGAGWTGTSASLALDVKGS